MKQVINKKYGGVKDYINGYGEREKMLYIKKRRESLLHDAEEIYSELFRTSICEIQRKYRQDEYRESVIKAFVQVVNSWGCNYDKPVASLGICSLYSSISMNTYAYRLRLSGQGFWLDKEAVETEWVPRDFFKGFEDDMHLLFRQLRNSYPRLCRNEEEAIRFLCADYYNAAVYKLCKDMIKEIMDNKEFTGLDKTDNFFVYFGKYMGKGEIIYKESL